MKKIILFLLLFTSFYNISFAEIDFENDYTLIDCIDGDNSTGVAFDKEKPYQTLKSGIENTISYINTNINKSGNQETASGKVFNIKVNCTALDMLNSTIDINFDGITFNNKLIIEGVNDNSLVFDNITIKHYSKTGNYEINNAIFKNYTNPIFISDVIRLQKPQSKGVMINNSIFHLKNNLSLGTSYTYQYYWRDSRGFGHRSTRYSYLNEQVVNNSILNIEIDNNSNFKLFAVLTNNKLNFKNKSENINNVNISIAGSSVIGSSVVLSNEIDLGGNNLSIQDNNNIGFINNKFTNFNDITLPGNTVFLNNTFENKNEVNISNTRNFFNNTFKNSFVDTYDTLNLRKNYLSSETGAKGIGWFYKRKSTIPYFDINLSSHELTKQITGIDIPNLKDSVYVIFNK